MRLIQNGRSVPKLLVLCRKYGVDVPDDVLPKHLTQATQETWVQKSKLRYQITGEPPKDEDLTLLRDLDFIDDKLPAPQFDDEGSKLGFPVPHFAGALLLGALYSRVDSRLGFLWQQEDHIQFDAVYLLGGARSLDSTKESLEILCSPASLPFKPDWKVPKLMPTTEAEMMEYVWQRSPLPDTWKYELVNTPLQPKPDGSTRPPNTGDTIREWLTKHSPKPGHYLAISNQPFVQYQELVLQRLLPQKFTVCACGPCSSLTLPLSTYLDNIAKQLYEETLVAG